MPRFAYVNGRYVAHSDAAVHIEDRGYQFSDGVYEVVTVKDGRLIDATAHMDRLDRSLDELQIAWPVARPVLQMIMAELIKRNALRDGLVYMQVTRGVAPRDHAFPKGDVRPALVMTTKRLNFAKMTKFTDGVSVISAPDQRWARRDIKTISLLPNCLNKQKATEAGCYEAWQVDPKDGKVTEGTASNAWIINEKGELITRPATHRILNGITRLTILKIAEEEGIPFVERAFSLDEAKRAKEAFASSATSFVTPVVKIDDSPVGDGKVGPICRKLLAGYNDYVAGLRTGGAQWPDDIPADENPSDADRAA
jgi:D-alanine transaminase